MVYKGVYGNVNFKRNFWKNDILKNPDQPDHAIGPKFWLVVEKIRSKKVTDHFFEILIFFKMAAIFVWKTAFFYKNGRHFEKNQNFKKLVSNFFRPNFFYHQSKFRTNCMIWVIWVFQNVVFQKSRLKSRFSVQTLINPKLEN